MPPLFSAGYSPITAAGTTPQIQHVGRLIASQLTAAGVGPGVEQAKEEEVIYWYRLNGLRCVSILQELLTS